MGDMDSGNSGSLQSSSGGEDEYDSSRATAADSFSTFFNHHQIYAPTEGHHVTLGSYPNPPPPPPPSFFDPLSTYFDHLSRSTNPSPVLNPDPVWLKETNTIVRSDPSLIPTTSGPGLDHLPPSSSTTDKQISGGGARNPRKRTRASRRAPTTVLTTDTTNFRAMVQEFTGIPAPPFGSSAGSSSSLFFPRTRFDLFGNTRGAMDAPAPPYLLRPLAQKIQIPTLDTTNKNSDSNADVMAASSSSGGNYHMDLGLLNLPFKYPGPEAKPAPGGSLELPGTIRNVNNNNNNNNEEVQVRGPLGWAEGLGLGADAGAGAGGASGGSRSGNMSAQHSHQRPQNLGFAHQQIG